MSLLPRNRVLRALVWVVVGALGLEALYLVVANIALASMTKRYRDNRPVGVTFDLGYTWFPGRFHFRHVRLGDHDDFATLADADVAFSVTDVITTPRRIRSITADVTGIELALQGKTWRATGNMHVVVGELVIDDGDRIACVIAAKLDRTTLESEGNKVASDLHGTIDVRAPAFDPARESLLDKASGTVAIDGAFDSFQPLASLASMQASQSRGTLTVHGTLEAGVVAVGSEVRARTAYATLMVERGDKADFPSGLSVGARADGLFVETPKLVFASADTARVPDELDDYELGVPLKGYAMTSLHWSSRHVALNEGGTLLTAQADGDLRFEPGHAGEIVANGGAIRAKGVVLEGILTRDHTPFDANMILTRLSLSHKDGMTIAGRVHAEGPDARPIVDRLVEKPAIRQALDSVDTTAFTLDATMKHDPAGVAFDDLVLRSTGMNVRGKYRRAYAKVTGAFVLEGGPIPVGLTVTGANETIRLAPPPGWLDAQP